MAEYACCVPIFWLYMLICCFLVVFAGIMSGLTLGLMSLSIVDLEVLLKAGKPHDQRNAARILPVVKNHHLLLCTLLIGNALAMEALPIFLDKLVPAWGAILISVTLILIFGEIIPQAVCTRYGLRVGAKMAPFVRVLVIIIFPIAYPISKLLDLILGKDHVMLMRRSELKTLVDMHGNEAGKGGELTHDETTIISGALDLTQKIAKDSMTPIVETFSLDINAKLDMETMGLIMRKGHSRVPIYSGSPTNIIGLILVKNLITCRTEDEIPVRNVTIRTIPRVYDDLPLYDILNEFQKGHSHMAVVVKRNKVAVGPTENSSLGSRSNGMINPGNSSLGSRSNINGGDSTSTRQQQMRRGARQSKNILDISNTDALPSYNLDEEVVGIITMEDVMEELLQEEILDETDEYVDVHNKIHINMLPPKILAAARSAGTTPLSQLIRKSPSASPFSPNHTITNNNDNYNNNTTNSNILHSPMASSYLQQQHSMPSRTFTPKKSLPSSPSRNSPSLSGQSSPLTQKVSKKPYEKLQKVEILANKGQTTKMISCGGVLDLE